MIKCPSCKGQSEVKYFKETDNGVIRKRRCIACGSSWETIETTVDKIQRIVRHNRLAIKAATDAFNGVDKMMNGFQCATDPTP
jgi:transcriptional regulator NrdR family protein